MTNYIFLIEAYLGLTILTFLYPKELQKRNHIVNAVIMIYFLILIELIFIPNGKIMSFKLFFDSMHYTSTEFLEMKNSLTVMNETVDKNFMYSLIIPAVFFLIGRVLLFFRVISLNTFDILYTGLIPFVFYIDFTLFSAVDGSIRPFLWNYLTFFVVYAMFSYVRIGVFMYFGIKRLIDDRNL